MNLINPIYFHIMKPNVQKDIGRAFRHTWSTNAKKMNIINTVIYEMNKTHDQNLNFEDINKPTRVRAIVRSRQAVMYYLLRYTTMTLKSIGAEFNQKYDHSTVLHARDTYQNLVDTYKADKECHHRIKEKLDKI
mgnify:CR=1 FL=1